MSTPTPCRSAMPNTTSRWATGSRSKRAGIEAADEVGAGPHGCVEQVGRAGIAQDPGLRERDHLHVGPLRVCLARRQHPLQPLETAVVSTWA